MDQLIKHHHDKVRHRKLVIQSYRAKTDAKRTMSDRLADLLTAKFGTITFLAINALGFGGWIAINARLVSFIAPFDPYPYGLLTTIASIEAIFLAVTVLISQNRAARVAEIREEIDLQLTSMSETEVTKAIFMLSLLLQKNGIDTNKDPALAEMLRPINPAELEKIIEDQIDQP